MKNAAGGRVARPAFSGRRARLGILVSAFVLLAAGSLSAQGFSGGKLPPGQLFGTIASMGNGTLTVTEPDGSNQVVMMDSSTSIAARVSATVADIKVGDSLGVAARRGSDGSLTATFITIFAPDMGQRVRRGQFPMQNGQVMTNAAVSGLVASTQSHTLTLQYDGGTATIIVPDDVMVGKIVTETPSDLTVGLHVMVRGTVNADGTVEAQSIGIGGQGRT